MRKILIALLTMVCVVLSAQDIYEQMPLVIVHQDSTITRLLDDKISGRERQLGEQQGYRVQIFSSNQQQTAKTEAFELEKKLNKLKLTEPIYVLYSSPFWKVRIGDYRTQEEAQLMREELQKLLPEQKGNIYVVRDQITIIE